MCREWVWRAADAEILGFTPENVGSHWGRGIQIDVVAVNWQKKTISLGEAKWEADSVSRDMVREFVEKAREFTPREFPGWTFHLADFARGGFTPAATQYAQEQQVRLIGLKELANVLQHGSRK